MERSYDKIEYRSQPEYKKELWEAAFGLQQTDGLTPSAYVRELAQDNIQGKLGYEEIYSRLSSYHSTQTTSNRDKEADIVSVRIVELLEKNEFILKPFMLKSIHRFLFTGVLPQLMTAGEYRTYDISKSEPVLNGESVSYTSSFMLFDTLEYDFSEEAKKTYKNMDDTEKVLAVKKFISGIWQIHPFEEGNTRTIAVFTELYLRSLDFQVDNQPFADNAQYFRDALVLDNTTNLAFKNGKPLEDFFLQLTRQEDKQIFNSLRKT